MFGYSLGDLGSILVMQGFAGLILFSVYLLMALGLAIIFGQMGVINMAHGEFMILGAYMTYFCSHLFASYLPGLYRRILLRRDDRRLHRLGRARAAGGMGADPPSLCAAARYVAGDLGTEPDHAAGVPLRSSARAKSASNCRHG